MDVAIYVAIAENGVIGRDGGLLLAKRLQEALKFATSRLLCC